MGRRLLALGMALVVLLGCSSQQSLPPPSPDTSAGSSDSVAAGTPTPSGSAELPVQASWTTQATIEGNPIRISIVGLRRIPQGTVLDYAVALVDGPDGRAAEVEQPLGLPAFDRYLLNASLIEPSSKTVLRPIADSDERCLCTFWSPTLLRPGQTELHQATFAAVPAEVTELVVQLADGPLVTIAVTPEGSVPVVNDPIAADAPATQVTELATTPTISYPLAPDQGESQSSITLTMNQVISTPHATSLVWTITAVADTPALSAISSPPVGDQALATTLNNVVNAAASGPGIRPSGSPDAPISRALFSTYRELANHRAINPENGWRLCLCSNSTAHELTTAGQKLTLVTTYPALPAGTSAVDVVFPKTSIAPLSDVAVSTAAPVTVEQVTTAVDTVSLGQERNLAGYTPSQWPTPVPDAESLAALTTPEVDDLIITESQPATDTQFERQQVRVSLDSTISFHPDSAALTPQATAAIERIATQINDTAAAGSTVSIDGYVAGRDRGSPAVQQKLSSDRAAAVLAALKPHLSVKVTLKATGHGANDPVAPNDTEANRALNRRVVISYTR